MLQTCAYLCEKHKLSDLRQYQYNIRMLKRLMRIAQKTKRSSKAKEPKEDKKLIQAYRGYLDKARQYIEKVNAVITTLKGMQLSTSDNLTVEQINEYIVHANRQADQINRRVVLGEVIPHEEKVLSIFQPHTEWISKGKAGVPVEFGLRVCILEDQYGFILHHKIMQKETDVDVAIKIVEETQAKLGNLKTLSFDKGFHSKENQEELSKKLDLLALPRKGKLSQAAKEHEDSQEFKKARKQHSAVESAINALEVHGLDVCRDSGINGFKRYVALAIVARNIHIIGSILHKKAQQKNNNPPGTKAAA
jgi:hypothetical protein